MKQAVDTKDKTIQEVIDEIGVRLRDQGGPSIGDNGYCLYRGSDGKRCAAGWLIDVDVVEGESIQDLIASSSSQALGSNHDFIKDNLDVIQDLQMIHDGAAENHSRINHAVCTLIGLGYSLDSWFEPESWLRDAAVDQEALS